MVHNIIFIRNIQEYRRIHGIHFNAKILTDDHTAIQNIIGIRRDITVAKIIMIPCITEDIV
ncbi:hypothetical protein D3C87_753940 [compost metagenome]